MDHDSNIFVEHLENHNIAGIKTVPKADLHNHFVLGGNRDYLNEKTGIYIPSFEGVLNSMQDMHNWYDKYLGERFNNYEMRKLLIEATMYQAHIDGIKIIEIGEDVWGLGQYFQNDVSLLIDAFKSAQQEIAPETELRLQIGLSRHCPVNSLEEWLEPFWGNKEFYSIDLYGDELAQPVKNFIPIYKKAKENGLRLKAHIGEWGEAEDILEGISLLGLDEIQHGISAQHSPVVIEYLVKENIRLNITPTSNVKLGRVESMKVHPIQMLYRSGVNVTINSDDILIFDSDVSKEYIRLFDAGTLTAEDLNDIRINGLS
jgi:Adenosine deaminase